MAAAPEDRERPRLAESADLVGSAISIRLRRMRLPTAREYRHARLMLPVRIAIAVWLVVLTAVLDGTGDGGWWGVVLVPAATIHLSIAFRLLQGPRPAQGPPDDDADR
jgi:hypothetical protein